MTALAKMRAYQATLKARGRAREADVVRRCIAYLVAEQRGQPEPRREVPAR